MLNMLLIATALLVAAYLAFSPRLRRSSCWKATVTPLASIMGSGFLVSAPLLGLTVGNYAVLFMAMLLLLAYMVGGAIRFNIRHFEPVANRRGSVQHIALLSRMVLAVAYFISVTYYLQLLAVFLLKAVGLRGELYANLVTTTLLLIIGGVGMWRGLGQLEKVESYAVSLNLGMITALLLGLVLYNSKLWLTGQWQLSQVSSVIDWHDIRVLLGLLIVVQGFETSRYLQEEHSANERVVTMRYAQWLSSGIYLLFIGLVTVLFQTQMTADVTAITTMITPVAVVLPLMIAIAAIGSQFSAAVADTSGAGGLIEEIVHHKLPPRYAYLAITVATVLLTWETNVNEIIAYASRAFALFYLLQSVVALMLAWQTPTLHGRKTKLLRFGFCVLACALVFVLGLPSE